MYPNIAWQNFFSVNDQNNYNNNNNNDNNNKQGTCNTEMT